MADQNKQQAHQPAVPPAAPQTPLPPNNIYGVQPGTVLQNNNYTQMGVPYTPPTPVPKQPFSATGADAWFALACFGLGYLFTHWLLMGWQGWGVTAFTVAYITAVLLYARAKRTAIPATSWFWLAALALCGLSYSLWHSASLSPLRGFMLFGLAVYWAATVFSGQLQRKTGNYLPLDAINLLFVVPFANFGTAFKGFAGFTTKSEDGKQKGHLIRRLLGVGLGLLICLPIIAILMPMLLEADGGNFANITDNFFENIENSLIFLFGRMWNNGLLFFLAIPVAMYLCGLVAGLGHRRHTNHFDVKKTGQLLQTVRILPSSTAITVLVGVSALYLIFVASQAPYFFSAFFGQRPNGFEVYSLYAREGFFELCRMVAINLGLLCVVNSLCRKTRAQNPALCAMNIILSLLTILLASTALSKMALYIAVYGLTPKRVLTCVAIVFFVGVCAAVIALQFKQFSIVRVSAIWGTVLVCLLCMVNIDALIVRYNANRYMNGTLREFDVSIINGGNGADAALDVYEFTDDEELKEEIAEALNLEQRYYTGYYEDHQQTIVTSRLRKMELPETEQMREERLEREEQGRQQL